MGIWYMLIGTIEYLHQLRIILSLSRFVCSRKRLTQQQVYEIKQ
jgi:hypothetical protein